MNITFLHQPWPYLVIAAFAGLIGWYVWTQPRRPGTRYFAWAVVVWFVWALAAAILTLVSSPNLRYGLWVIQCVCALATAPLELLFSIEYTGNEKWLARRSLYLIFLPALLLLILAFLIPGSADPHAYHFGIEKFVRYNLLRWGLYSYAVILVLVNLGILFACLLRAPAFWAPILLIMIGRIVPTAAFVTFDPAQMVISPIQVTILLDGVSMLAYLVALYNFGLLRVVPVARDMAIACMPYGLIVLDAENRLVDFNSAARELPGLPQLPARPSRLAQRQLAFQTLGEWWEKLSSLIESKPVSEEVTVQADHLERVYRVISLPLLQASGWRMGQVFLFEDITEARMAQRQQAQALWAQATLEERGQLANELHDGISQSLAFLNLQSQAAQIYLQSGQNQAAKDTLVRLSEAAGGIHAETREMIGSLLSVGLPAENFYDALRQVVAGFEQSTHLAVRLEMDIDPAERIISGDTRETPCSPPKLPPPTAVQLIRITQEALANVRKHARGACQVSVRLKVCNGQVWLTIADDGAGFNPADQREGEHFGLQVMQQRAARIGGQILIDSMPRKGTRVEVHVPLEAPLAPAIPQGSK